MWPFAAQAVPDPLLLTLAKLDSGVIAGAGLLTSDRLLPCSSEPYWEGR